MRIAKADRIPVCDSFVNADGLYRPARANTGRISIFLRFLDALCGRRRFAALIESDSAGFISDATQSTGAALSYLEQERTLFGEFGVDLTAIEDRVCLRPGDMLLLDNVTVVHGRVGQRPPREVWQMLFGLPDPAPSSIQRIVDVACGACTD